MIHHTLHLGPADSLAISWAWLDSAHGPALALATDLGLCGLGLAAQLGRDWTQADLMRRFPRATFAQGPMPAAMAQRALTGQAISLHLLGSAFDLHVWQALLHIPMGQTTSYSQLAATIGAARAHRAVASAVGRNPLGLIVPCHRVLRSTGALGGYHWGLGLKAEILAQEKTGLLPLQPPPAQEMAVERNLAIP
jgi:AraC family transcriptional regulator of adaptative response/methylated-DNA-[protein]-cysteine methyltransferase